MRTPSVCTGIDCRTGGRGFRLKNAACLCRVTDKPAEAVTGAPLAEAAEEAMVAAGGDPADGPTPEEEAEAEAKVTLGTCHGGNMFCMFIRLGTSITLPMHSLGNHTQAYLCCHCISDAGFITVLFFKLHSVCVLSRVCSFQWV